MRKPKVCRMILATCVGSFIVVVFYFQTSLEPGKL
uniref:Carbohydrate sulfotransferase n=1 Tax=Anguilla anguilla TaxID=7936 RepID=A0A0E9WCB3_ANGAN